MTCSKRQTRRNGIEIEAVGMNSFFVREHRKIERKRFYGFRRLKSNQPVCVEELTSTRPQLQQEIVDRVVSVRECSERRSIKLPLWLMEKPSDPMKSFPCQRQCKLFLKLLSILRPRCRILKQVTPVDQAFRSIMVWHAEHRIANTLQPKQ